MEDKVNKNFAKSMFSEIYSNEVKNEAGEVKIFSPKEMLLYIFNVAKTTNATHIGVDVVSDMAVKPEMIINTREDFDTKLNYYDKVYDDNLVHYHVPVKITNVVYGHSAEQVVMRLELMRTERN